MPTATRESAWDARIARARELASARPAARELLTFYAALAERQRALAASASDDERFDVERVSDAVPGFLDWLRENGRSELAASVDVDAVAAAFGLKSGDSHSLPPDQPPLKLRRSAGALAKAEGGSHPYAELMASGSAGWEAADISEGVAPDFSEGDAFQFSEGVASGPSTGSGPFRAWSRNGFSRKDAAVAENPATLFVIETLQQAFAEPLANGDVPRTLGSTPMRCPRCAALPVVAVLREEGHGAKRSLLCAICLHEWQCLRLVCPACGEEEFDKLPVYTAEQFADVRIDACDRCRHYIKTIDLTKDGLAVPCVDDIASVSLDLWARERGYTRVKTNLLGF